MRYYCDSCAVVEVPVEFSYCTGCLNSMLVDMAILWDKENDERYLDNLKDKAEDLHYSYSAQLYLF
jgi:hypothetical protein